MRLIDADALLKDISAARECGGMDEIVAGTLRRYILRQPVIAQANEWVSTDKCTPEPMKDVLVMFENGIMCVGFTYYDYRLLNRWSIHIDHALYQPCPINPKYWTLLPKPPKGTEDVAENATTESNCNMNN